MRISVLCHALWPPFELAVHHTLAHQQRNHHRVCLLRARIFIRYCLQADGGIIPEAYSEIADS